MTPEEELKRLNKLIHQYETVQRTTTDGDQRERVERELKGLRDYRDKILAVNVVDSDSLDDKPRVEDPLAGAPRLKSLLVKNELLPDERPVAPFVVKGATPTTSQLEMYHLALYAAQFEKEFLPFLTEKKLKLNFKYSMDRDSFYGAFQGLSRRLDDYRRENSSVLDGKVSREKEGDMRKRMVKLARLVASDGARFFRALERFAGALAEDAAGEAVECLNSDAHVHFDAIEGQRLLEGHTVADSLGILRDFAEEAVTYLNIPEIETQEN